MDLCPQPQQCSLWIQLNISLEGQLGIIRQGQDNGDMKDITIIVTSTLITIKVMKISNNGTCRQVAGKRRSCQVHTGRSPRPEADAPDGLFTPQVSFLELDKGAHKKNAHWLSHSSIFLIRNTNTKYLVLHLVVFAQYS